MGSSLGCVPPPQGFEEWDSAPHTGGGAGGSV